MLTVREIMTTSVVTFDPETTIREAMETLSTSHLSGAPVLSGNRVVGLLSMSDILSFIVSAPESKDADQVETVADSWEERIPDDEDLDDVQSSLSDDMLDEWVQNSDGLVDNSNPGEKSLLDQHTVEEAMNHEVFSVEPSVSVKKAANLMHERGIHRLLVMHGRKLEGIVSALDIARAVSERGVGGHGLTVDPCSPKSSPWIDL
jgi:CBS domain-containing protein